jgi:hypothetical protein
LYGPSIGDIGFEISESICGELVGDTGVGKSRGGDLTVEGVDEKWADDRALRRSGGDCGELVDDTGLGSPATNLTRVWREGFVDDAGLGKSEGECGELTDDTGLQRSGGIDPRIAGGGDES